MCSTQIPPATYLTCFCTNKKKAVQIAGNQIGDESGSSVTSGAGVQIFWENFKGFIKDFEAEFFLAACGLLPVGRGSKLF